MTIYYCIHGDTAGKPALRVAQTWCCLHEDNEELSAAQMFQRFFSPADSSPESERPGHIKEAVSDYVTDLLDERIVGDKLTTALWEASKDCPVFRVDPIMQTVNGNVKTGLSNGLNLFFRDAGLPALPAGAISGITTDFFLGEETKILRTASITFEVIGVAVGTLTMNPALVTACVHSLMEKAVMQAVSTAINQGLTGETAISTVSDQQAITKTEAADAPVTRQSEDAHSRAVTALGTPAEETSAASHISTVGSDTQQGGGLSIEKAKEALELAQALIDAEKTARESGKSSLVDQRATEVARAADAKSSAAGGMTSSGP